MPQILLIGRYGLYPELEVGDVLVDKTRGVRDVPHDASPIPLPELAPVGVGEIISRSRAVKCGVEFRRKIVHPAMAGIVVKIQHRHKVFAYPDLPLWPDLLGDHV